MGITSGWATPLTTGVQRFGYFGDPDTGSDSLSALPQAPDSDPSDLLTGGAVTRDTIGSSDTLGPFSSSNTATIISPGASHPGLPVTGTSFGAPLGDNVDMSALPTGGRASPAPTVASQSNGLDQTSDASSAAADPTFTVSTPGSGLVFNNTVTGTYAGNTLTQFENDIVSAETMLEKQATNTFTINVELEAENQGANNDGASNNAAARLHLFSISFRFKSKRSG